MQNEIREGGNEIKTQKEGLWHTANFQLNQNNLHIEFKTHISCKKQHCCKGHPAQQKQKSYYTMLFHQLIVVEK